MKRFISAFSAMLTMLVFLFFPLKLSAGELNADHLISEQLEDEQPGTGQLEDEQLEDEADFFQVGTASWYGGKFQGELTANGEIFDTFKISAAHKELTFGSVVRVYNLENGLSVDVRINDRGPYVKQRIIDLSYAAAEEIDMIENGTAEVGLELLYSPALPESAYNRLPDVPAYRIQVGAFSSIDRFCELSKQFAEWGYETASEETDSGLLRLSVISIPREELQETQEDLTSRGFTDVIIRPWSSADEAADEAVDKEDKPEAP